MRVDGNSSGLHEGVYVINRDARQKLFDIKSWVGLCLGPVNESFLVFIHFSVCLWLRSGQYYAAPVMQ